MGKRVYIDDDSYIDGGLQPYEMFGGASIQGKKTKSRTDRKASLLKRKAKERKKRKAARRK